MQDPRRVGENLDTRTHDTEDGGGLEQYGAVTGVRERVSHGEATEARANDNEVATKDGTMVAVEWRDLLEEDICV